MQVPTALQGLLDRVDKPRLRTRYAVPALGVALYSAMLALGGAWSPAVPLTALAACVAAWLSGVDRISLRIDPVLRLLAVMLVAAALLLTPLPPALLRLLDAASEQASRDAWAPWGIDLSRAWRPLHRDPGTGRGDLVYLLGLLGAYVAAAQASRRDTLEKVYTLCGSVALVAALIGLAHLGTDQNLLYGFYRPAQASPPVLSPLLNPNHLAALTGTGAILWLGAALDAERALSRALNGVAAALCGGTCALTLSRGGVASAAAGLLLLLALEQRTEYDAHGRKPRRRTPPQALVGAAIAVAVFAAGAWLGSRELARELTDGDLSKLDVFRRAASLLRGHLILGYGSGSLPVVASWTGRLDADRTFLRAESLPLDMALSLGVLPAVAASYFGLRALWRWAPPAKATASATAAWVALVALVAHDMVDFSLHLGGVGYVAAALAGVLTGHHDRGWGRPLPRSTSLHRGPAVVLALAVLAVGAFAWRAGLEDDRDAMERALRASRQHHRSDAARAAVARHPADPYLQLLLGTYAVADGHPSSLRFVARAITLAPSWAQPHLLLARVFALGGRRGQCLVELRATMERSTALAEECGRLALRLRPLPVREELEHIATPGASGLRFLDAVARGATRAEYVTMVDEVILARAADHVPALSRRVSVATMAGDLDAASAWCERIERAAPTETEGVACRASVRVARRDFEGALLVLDRGLARVRDRYPLHAARARVFTELRNAAAMRREVQAMLDVAGSTLQRIVEAHALRGALEATLGNDRPAYAAFEMADSLSVPDHPYALQLAQVATRLRDADALQVQCGVLLERSPDDPSTIRLCDRVGARRQGLLGGDAGLNP